MEHIQTPRKSKTKSTQDSDEWFVQEDDKGSMSQPFEKVDMFDLEDPLSGGPFEDRVDLIETFLVASTKEHNEISKTTGRMLKETKVAQEYHVTVMNEITGKVGLKLSKFPSAFNGPSLWSTTESLGHYALSIDSEISPLSLQILMCLNKQT